ncbi:LuxR C-terminal-related transcriptional regulator [Cryptosporangium arvum]|uniref:LuxR C-terminal-related transcriptional regulator n=1 Tax=Cryptosporangium arvum TaxID=80871 RepID=UPI001B80E5CB
MPLVDGISATRRIVDAQPSTRVLVLTTFADDADLFGALGAGAIGYLVKDGPPEEMIDAVRRAALGEPRLAPSVLSRIVARAVEAHAAASSAPPAHPLTLRETEVPALVGAGLSNAEIGAALHLGVTTVKTHVSAAMEKLGLRNRVQAAVTAHRLGLVDDQFRPLDR